MLALKFCWLKPPSEKGREETVRLFGIHRGEKTGRIGVTGVPLGLNCRPVGALFVMVAAYQGLTPPG